MGKQKLSIIARGALLIAVVSGGVYWYFEHSEKYPSADDSYVNANLVNVAPKVSGYVEDILVKNNQFVHKGDVLFRIAPTDYSVQLDQQQQGLQYAIQQANNAKAQISTAEANVASAKVNYDNALAQFKRYQDMNKLNAASTQNLQTYETQFAQAKAQLVQAQNTLTQDKILVEAANAQVKQSEAQVATAKNNVGYTDVVSSVNGFVTNMYLTKGQYLAVGQQVFGLVDNDSWWIDANFKETDLERVKEGQPVDIELDMYKHAHYKGTVQSLSYASGTTFSLLPPQNATGNWVKVTQRFTIRIKVENNPKFPLRVGASANVQIDTTK
jgi:membrane fusion protein (multidrug efflux system)